jgi:hypothetical protein
MQYFFLKNTKLFENKAIFNTILNIRHTVYCINEADIQHFKPRSTDF